MHEIEEMYEDYSGMVHSFLLRLCGNQDLAEELTQETFYRAVKGWLHFHNQSSVPTWLCAIVKRLYWSSLRKKAAASLETETEPSVPDFTEQLARRDRAMVAQRLLHRLPEPYREVFTLRTFCDLTHAEIGELFAKSGQWARVTYYRARKMLADTLKESEHDEDGL